MNELASRIVASCAERDGAFTLSADGARRFGEFTESNIGNALAVVLDGKIQSVATIQSRITDSGRITGRFSQQRANDLSLVLRAGALPASMQYLEERTVGPSLGADSIRAGLTASLAGFLAVVIFMLIYYRMAGVNAVVVGFLAAALFDPVMTTGIVTWTDAVIAAVGLALLWNEERNSLVAVCWCVLAAIGAQWVI